MRFLRLLAALLVAGAALSVHPSARGVDIRTADAAVAIAYSLDELVGQSQRVVIGKAIERRSLWEIVGDSKRIVTYTRLEIQESIVGKGGASVWVRTLGGAVGRIGQQVAGEAEFTIGKRALVFLTSTDEGVTVVSGAAQGHFPIVRPVRAGKPRTLKLSPALGTIVPRRGPSLTIQEALSKKPLDEALAAIRDAKARIDAARRK